MRLHYSGEVQRKKKKTVQIHLLREFYSVQINTGNDGKEAIKFSDINSVQNERDALHCSSLLISDMKYFIQFPSHMQKDKVGHRTKPKEEKLKELELFR